jgi:hypothetical protein
MTEAPAILCCFYFSLWERSFFALRARGYHLCVCRNGWVIDALKSVFKTFTTIFNFQFFYKINKNVFFRSASKD